MRGHSAFPSSFPIPIVPSLSLPGRSNVGKSSLLNKIFNRRSLARVSSMPGKTATINFYRAGEVRFVDLPGYGFAKVAKGERRRWDELIGGYFGQSRDIRIVFLLVDMRHPPSSDDLTMANYLIDTEMPFVVLLTKADQAQQNSENRASGGFCPGVSLRRGDYDDSVLLGNGGRGRCGAGDHRGSFPARRRAEEWRRIAFSPIAADRADDDAVEINRSTGRNDNVCI